MNTLPAKHMLLSWKIRLILVAALTLGQFAQAQILQRPIPDDAKRATIQHVQGMMVSLDGKPLLMAPGGFIRDSNNLIIVPSALPRDGALARFILDTNGQVFRVWLLTREEQAAGQQSWGAR
jgi:hypothetical protein